MSAPNLSGEQARKRAALLEVDSYTIELDLTDGKGSPSEVTFRSTTTVRFRSREVGATSWIDLVAGRIRRAELNGAPLDVAAYRPCEGIVLPRLAEVNELRVQADCEYMNTG